MEENKNIHNIEKVVTGPVKIKKKSTLNRLTEEFISEDAKNIKNYVFGDVLIPTIKKAISDIITDGIHILLYGETKKKSERSLSDRVSYKSYYEDRDYRYTKPSERNYNYANRNRFSYDDIVLSTRGEAENVLNRLDEILDMYGVIRVPDLYDLVGITGDYTENNYGWTSIRTAEIVRTRDGYLLKMPRAVPID